MRSASKRLSHRSRPQRRQARSARRYPGKFLRPEVLKLEQIAELPARALGDDHGVRLGQGLQARREVRRLADDAALLRRALADQVADHDQPGGDADTRLQGASCSRRTDRIDHLQPRPHRLLGVVLMRLRIAEIDQHAVAHVFGDEAVETAHGLGDALLIGGNDLAQVLRVHAGGKRRRADEIARTSP